MVDPVNCIRHYGQVLSLCAKDTGMHEWAKNASRASSNASSHPRPAWGGGGEILLSLDLKTVVQTRPLDSRNDIPLPDRTYTPQFGQTVASVLPEMTMSPMRQPKAALDKSP